MPSRKTAGGVGKVDRRRGSLRTLRRMWRLRAAGRGSNLHRFRWARTDHRHRPRLVTLHVTYQERCGIDQSHSSDLSRPPSLPARSRTPPSPRQAGRGRGHVRLPDSSQFCARGSWRRRLQPPISGRNVGHDFSHVQPQGNQRQLATSACVFQPAFTFPFCPFFCNILSGRAVQLACRPRLHCKENTVPRTNEIASACAGGGSIDRSIDRTHETTACSRAFLFLADRAKRNRKVQFLLKAQAPEGARGKDDFQCR